MLFKLNYIRKDYIMKAIARNLWKMIRKCVMIFKFPLTI
ncbi:hypothetical protein CCACVL1_18515 [Corchorus capsularis]|uniref:Uncharacterized protein n=1 Tax=Corchorus capsularis TaxID=210143 RepID=A0A1R3HL22_COCAP|nr:hypothetical protein CCACVL1_18515 [Corchorus capsularis]